jgi:signal transduction histidine kinase
MATGEVLPPIEHRLFHRDGSTRWVRNQRVLRYTPEGQLAGYDGLVSDITVRKAAEEALRNAVADLQKSHEDLKASQLLLIHAEKMKTAGRLAAGVAHEVKNPLAILLLSLDYLSGVLPEPGAPVAEVLQDMRDAVGRADTIIRGLLDFSASEKLDLQPGDLNSVIEKAILLVRHSRQMNHVQLVKSLAPGLPPAAIDQNKAVQALVNLFSNAIDAMPDGGTLAIRSYLKQPSERDAGSQTSGDFRAEAAWIAVEMEDSGSGIPPDKLTRIFDPFFTTKPPGKGTGLGLTVTQKIMELHEGVLQITNRQEGGVRACLLFRALNAK